MTVEEILAEIVEAAKRADEVPATESSLFGIDPGTYRLWKAMSGNAKARRRWRRRDVLGRQKEEKERKSATLAAPSR